MEETRVSKSNYLVVYMDDEELYDEFGNYLGDKNVSFPNKEQLEADDRMSILTEEYRQSVILPEHRQLYPSAQDTFGPEVETLVFEEDTQTLDQPIITPSEKRNFTKKNPFGEFPYSDEFLRQVLDIPGRSHSVAFVGALHSGKTSLIDMLLEGAYGDAIADRAMDHWLTEQDRGITLSTKPFTILLKDSKNVSRAITLIDSPGHCDFCSEQTAAIDMADMCVLVIDALEGVTMGVEETMKRLEKSGKSYLLFINKIDRLILELKLAPNDAYFKLKHIIDTLNSKFTSFKLRPETGTVVFGSALHRWSFSLQTIMERLYGDSDELWMRMFGDIYHDAGTGKFEKSGEKRSFVQFILEPIYKVYTATISNDSMPSCIPLSKKEYRQLDIKSLVRKALTRAIGWDYDWLFTFELSRAAGTLDTLAISQKGAPFEQQQVGFLVKVLSGHLQIGQTVHVFTEPGATPITVKISRMFVYQGGHRLVPLKSAILGAIVYIQSPEFSMIEYPQFIISSSPELTDYATATLLLEIHRHRQVSRPVVCKIGLEPILPATLPRMQEAIRRSRQCYGRALEYRVEETGEHTLSGPGELFMDCVMCNLRDLFSIPEPTEIRISDPTVVFCETIIESSTVTCYADTPNQKATVSMLAEPLEPGLAEAIEDGLFANRIGDSLSMARVGAVLRDKYGWDILAARSILAVGPDPDFGPNVLINDILPGGNKDSDLEQYFGSVIQAFQWTCRQGPLVESTLRACKFRLVDIAVREAVPSGQLIPAARRACFAAMITATAKLMEPVLRVDTICPFACIESVVAVLGKRRGHVISDQPLPGTPFYTISALVPAIDSYGLECDLRISCQGKASVQSILDHWQPVPGDPMDTSIKVPPLTAAPAPAMARDFIQKTRKRKGLVEEVKIERFLDNRMLRALSSLSI